MTCTNHYQKRGKFDRKQQKGAGVVIELNNPSLSLRSGLIRCDIETDPIESGYVSVFN